MKYKLKDFYRGETNVFVLDSGNRNDILYTDGNEIENNIYNIIKESKNRSIWSQELISKIIDWPTEYHFSPLRHNLLRHINFKETDHILELGCGCGAITRQLGETGAKITSVEGTLNRAKSAAARCNDLANVEIYCSNFQNVEFGRQYDYVTLIGVLEYAPLFFDGKHPFEECLMIVKNALKPNGKLIIAIENRLGLKYFNGLGEDHVGKPYFGIEDLYNSGTAKTLGKYELELLLKGSGFDFIKFQYPFPDYKLPEVIIDESAFEHKDFNYSELIRFLKSRDYSNNSQPNFSEFMAWKTISENKLLGHLSNSFLVISSAENFNFEGEFLAVKYTTNRKREYNTKTIFSLFEGTVNVFKSKLLSQELSANTNLVQNISDDKYHYGTSLNSLIGEKIHRDNFEEFVACIKIWLSYLIEQGLINNDISDKFNTPLTPHFIDCLPGNIIVFDQSLQFIDQEWEYKMPFTIKTLFVRYWLNEVRFHSDFIARHIPSTPNDLLITFAKIFGIELDDDTIKEHFDIFNEIGETVYGGRSQYSMFFNEIEDSSSDRQKLRFINKVKSKLKRILSLS